MMAPKTRLFLETAFAVIFAAIFVTTVLWPDWIELVFGADPDQGSGEAEWAVVVASGALSVIAIFVARVEWNQQHRLPNKRARI
jgi:hypothetical protein